MDKYQFFISSTYEDLRDERNSAINAVMKQHQIPAGMELFGAMGEQQWEYIKREIDDSDYYLLILAGKYGSLNSHGISYTEAEYDYACRKKKRIIAFLYDDIEQLPLKKVEQDIEKKTKLNKFRDKVKRDKLVEFWDNPQHLVEKISSAISNVMREFPSETKWIHCTQSFVQNRAHEQEDMDYEEDDWKFEEAKDINVQLEISSDTKNPSQAVMTGSNVYVILQSRDGAISSYMRHSCEEYVKLISCYNEVLFKHIRFFGKKEILCLRKLWFDTKNGNVLIYVDYLYNYDIKPTYSVEEIKRKLYNDEVLGDGQAYTVLIRTLGVNMSSDHFFINNREYYDEDDLSKYVEVKVNYTKFKYADAEQKRQVVAELEVTNKSKKGIAYKLDGIFKILDSNMCKVCYATNHQGTLEFALKPLETKVEYFVFVTNEPIDKIPDEIEVSVESNKPEYM